LTIRPFWTGTPGPETIPPDRAQRLFHGVESLSAEFLTPLALPLDRLSDAGPDDGLDDLMTTRLRLTRVLVDLAHELGQ
jgi:hypothetical protein